MINTKYYYTNGDKKRPCSLNRSPALATRCQQQVGCTVRSKALWVMATWGPPPSRGQIQDSPRRGHWPSRSGHQHTNLPGFPKKLHEIRKILVRRGVRAGVPPLDPPLPPTSWTDRCLWKHYLPATSWRTVNINCWGIAGHSNSLCKLHLGLICWVILREHQI